MELDLYERTNTAPDDPSAAVSLVQRKKVFGGVPSGIGPRSDVMKIFEELEEAKNVESQIQAILKERENTATSGQLFFFSCVRKLTVDCRVSFPCGAIRAICNDC